MRTQISQETIMGLLIIGIITSASSLVIVSLSNIKNNDSQYLNGYNNGYDTGYDDATDELTPPNPYEFNPIIDGIWDEEEGWDTNEEFSWLWAEYLIVDPNHMTATNYFYIHVHAGMLYILIDLISDITDETIPLPLEAKEDIIPESSGEGDEFISVWIDGDNSKQYFDDEYWALCPQETDAHDNFYYDVVDGFLDIAYVPYYSGYNQYPTTLGENNVTIAYGFNSSKNAGIEHRIWEIEINISALGYFNASEFNIGFMGYGTMLMYQFTGFWSAPTDLGIHHWFTSYIDEFLYFRCREVNGTDLWSNPEENTDPYLL